MDGRLWGSGRWLSDWVGTGARCRGAVGTDRQVGAGHPGAGGGLGAQAVHLCHGSWCRGALSIPGWTQGDVRGAKTPFWGSPQAGAVSPQHGAAALG